MTFFDDNDRKQLKNYKYVSGTYTYCDNLLNPLYVYLTTWFPEWVAPNLITFIGVLFSISSTIAYLYYKPNFQGYAPSWVYFYSAFCVVMYQALDYMDGKQARRLGVSGPLGELFDHGCDALNTFFFLINFSCALNLGSGDEFIYHLVICMFLFYFAQLTEYKTGVLLHSNSLFGVTEIQFTITLCHILPGIFGVDFYTKRIPYFNTSFLNIYLFIFFASSSSGIVYLLYHYLNPQNIVAKESRGNKNIEHIYQYVSITLPFMFFTLSTAYLITSPTKMFILYPALVTFFVGITFSALTTKIIISHVAKKPLAVFHEYLTPLIILTVSDYYRIKQLYYVYVACLSFQLFLYISFVVTVIRELCEIFNISCFSVKKKDQ